MRFRLEVDWLTSIAHERVLNQRWCHNVTQRLPFWSGQKKNVEVKWKKASAFKASNYGSEVSGFIYLFVLWEPAKKLVELYEECLREGVHSARKMTKNC